MAEAQNIALKLELLIQEKHRVESCNWKLGVSSQGDWGLSHEFTQHNGKSNDLKAAPVKERQKEAPGKKMSKPTNAYSMLILSKCYKCNQQGY